MNKLTMMLFGAMMASIALGADPLVPATQPAANFVNAVNGAKPGMTLNFSTGIVTVPTGVVNAAVSKLHLIGHGTTIRFTRPGNAGTGINVTADTEIEGFAFTSDKPLAQQPTDAKIGINAVRVRGGAINLHDCTVEELDTAVFFDDYGSGIVRRVRNNTKTLRSDMFYFNGAKHILLDHCYSPGSWNEHVVRIDAGTNGVNTAAYITIQDCDFDNWNGKETIACRTALGPVYVLRGTMRAWSRAGQIASAPPYPTHTVGYVEYNGVHFMTRGHIDLDMGVLARVYNCTCDNYDAYNPINVNGPNVDVFGSGIALKDIGAISDHSIVRTFGSFAPSDSVVVNNVTYVKRTTPPATQP